MTGLTAKTKKSEPPGTNIRASTHKDANLAKDSSSGTTVESTRVGSRKICFMGLALSSGQTANPTWASGDWANCTARVFSDGQISGYIRVTMKITRNKAME